MEPIAKCSIQLKSFYNKRWNRISKTKGIPMLGAPDSANILYVCSGLIVQVKEPVKTSKENLRNISV